MTTTHRLPARRTALAATASAVLGALVLTGCSSADTTSAGPAAAGGAYPMTVVTAFGESVIPERPQRVAVVDFVDRDIALALGVVPVIADSYGDTPLDPWAEAALDGLGAEELTTFDSTDGLDVEAIAAADPDVILATSSWSLDEDYDRLAAIAPVVAYEDEDGLTSMTWADRTLLAGRALGLEDEAQTVVDDVEDAFATARAEHPEFAGKTLTYSVIHPDQITYSTYAGSDVSFFSDLGFTLPEAASSFDEVSNGVSRENIDQLDADVLLMGYPFGDEALLSRQQLESDPLFTQLDAVREGHYGVLGDDVASPIAYPTPLSQPWVLEEVLPLLASLTSPGAP